MLSGNGGHWFAVEMANQGSLTRKGKLKSAIACSPCARRGFLEILREAHQMLFTEPKKRLSQS